MAAIIKSDPRAREKPCLRCGYSLRKLDDIKKCPECGLAIWISLSGNDTFDLSNPAWIRKIKNGCWMMAAAHFFALPAVLLNFRIIHWQPLVWLGSGALLLHCQGLFILAQPERRYPDKVKSQRLWAWIACFIALAIGPWSAFVQSRDRATLTLTAGALFAASAPWPLLRKLIWRAPHPKLARWAGWMMAFPASALLLLLPAIMVIVWEFPHLPAIIAAIYLICATVVLVLSAITSGKTIPEAIANWETT